MNYISVEEMAKKWGVKQRQVQTLLANGRIPGATKYGRVWMVPHDAEKPADLRRRKDVPEKADPPAYPARDMRAIQDIFDAVSDKVDEGRLRMYDESGLSYLRGDFEMVKQCYRETENDNEVRLRVSLVAIAAAISTGDYEFYLEIEAYLKNVIRETEDESVSALADLALASAPIGALVPSMTPEWLKVGDFSRLPEMVRSETAYLRAKYFQSVGDITSMLTVAQTALPFCNYVQEFFFPGVYLKLMCAVVYHIQNRVEDAEKWLLDAMHSNLQFGLITPFAEVIPVLGGLVEELLKREYPQYFDAVIAQWERTFSNWATFHNRFTKDNVTMILSRREYQMGMLVAQGVSLKEIAARFHISLSRQKAIMNEIYGKLLIKGRRELSKNLITPPKNSTFSR